LLISVNKNIILQIGALGKLSFKKGNYVYVGSAMNNLEKRIQRHLCSKKKIFWHIDYLLSDKNVKIKKVFYKESTKKEECEIAKKVAKEGVAVEKFGCSDCKCKSHLFELGKDFLILDLGMDVWT